jgi:hypothetical protein
MLLRQKSARRSASPARAQPAGGVSFVADAEVNCRDAFVPKRVSNARPCVV